VLEVLKDNNMNSNLAFDILEDELRRESCPLPALCRAVSQPTVLSSVGPLVPGVQATC
jgi:hypothetical protein